MSPPVARVVFTPSGRRGEFEPGTTVLQAARQLGVDIDSVCGGRGLCGRCQVKCSEGEFTKHAIVSRADNLSARTSAEHQYAQRRGLRDERRLGCQARIKGHLVIDVPAESQLHRQLIRKDADHRSITLDTATRLHFVEVAEATLQESRSDFRRLCDALESEWQLAGLTIELAALQLLQSALRDGQWSVTVAVYQGSIITAVWPGYRDNLHGVALDLGSTTIAAHLCDLHSGKVVSSGGIMNPQIRFGEDLMSRVSYVMMRPEATGELTDAVRQGICDLVDRITDDAGLSAQDVLELCIVGNPVMHHLLLGISPVELGGAPFALASDTGMSFVAGNLGLSVHPGARVYLLPCIAGHVGADTAGMILSEEPHRHDELSLLIDVGTNAEIVLGDSKRLLACSSPTGPAFEGAQISCGQRAAPGAIERVRIDRDTLEPRFRIIGVEPWSDDPGFPAALGGLQVTGICGSGIIEAVAEMYLAGILSSDGVVNGQLATRSPRLQANDRTWSYQLHDGEIPVVVTQNDVRQIQLAKAALYAGVKLLMERMGVDQVDRIRLAGAFGSHIDVRYAMVLGLLPDCDLERVASAGNAAGSGARIALLNQAARREIEQLVLQVEKVETAIAVRFQEHFVAAMAIPHSVDPFERLFRTVRRPEPVLAASAGKRRRRGRQRRA